VPPVAPGPAEPRSALLPRYQTSAGFLRPPSCTSLDGTAWERVGAPSASPLADLGGGGKKRRGN